MKRINRVPSKENKQSAWDGFIKQLENEKDYIDISAYVAFQAMSAMRLLGLKQKDVAERLQVSPQQISKILSGQENLTIETIGRLATVLGIDIDISNSGVQKFLNPSVVFVESVEDRDHYFAIKIKQDYKKSVDDHLNEDRTIIENIPSKDDYSNEDYVTSEEILGVLTEETAICN